jgi:hemerythrin HHE cation binding domain-containing protein
MTEHSTSSADTRTPDVLDLVRRQHAQIRDLFDEVDACSGDERRDAFDRLVRLLAVHETAEEEVVHPLARTATAGGSGLVDARLGEEYMAKEMLVDLERMGPDAPAFPESLDRLRLAVLKHARGEERYELPKIQREAPAATIAAAAPGMRAAMAMAPTHPHPGAESATANMLGGPMLAMADRVRDAIRKSKGENTAGR